MKPVRIWMLAALLGVGAMPVFAQASGAATAMTHAGNDAGLQTWLADFRSRAVTAGIDAQVFDAAMTGVRYDADVIQRDRNQSEFTKTIWEYLKTATSDLRIANGKKALADNRAALEQIEKT